MITLEHVNDMLRISHSAAYENVDNICANIREIVDILNNVSREIRENWPVRT